MVTATVSAKAINKQHRLTYVTNVTQMMMPLLHNKKVRISHGSIDCFFLLYLSRSDDL